MAPINPPTYLQAGTYSARLDRLSQAGLLMPAHGSGALAIRSGVRPTPSNTGLQVTQRSTPAMFVTVGAGVGYVQAQSATGGVYIVNNDASYDVAIAAAHATLGRRDLIVARIYDAEVSGATNEWRLEAVTGTPAGSPVTPATPAGAVALASVLVSAGATTITNAAITDLRVYTTALGGTIPVLSSAMPANPYEGMAAYQTDLNRPVWFDGSAWKGWVDAGYQTAADVAAALDVYAPAYAHDEGNTRTISTVGSFVAYTGAPSVSVVVPASGNVLVTWGFTGYNSASDQASVRLGVNVTGTNSSTPTLGNSACVSGNLDNAGGANAPIRSASRTKLYTGLTPGSTTFTLQARISSGAPATHAISDSYLLAQPVQ
ncbi:hypothetical protein ACFFMN_23055 [Planobispora siamensis]|uniref:Minor tail protein n=1 Tax=Planobispora siamensis TaxID=936338 RepID=A0A8J3WPB1_9ACTN|nr:hypothetical protein [Planobispora siamensis]GIH95447.1 hypothetical protein Psi01_60770 [Planobispora siamensis]